MPPQWGRQDVDERYVLSEWTTHLAPLPLPSPSITSHNILQTSLQRAYIIHVSVSDACPQFKSSQRAPAVSFKLYLLMWYMYIFFKKTHLPSNSWLAMSKSTLKRHNTSWERKKKKKSKNVTSTHQFCFFVNIFLNQNDWFHRPIHIICSVYPTLYLEIIGNLYIG